MPFRKVVYRRSVLMEFQVTRFRTFKKQTKLVKIETRSEVLAVMRSQ